MRALLLVVLLASLEASAQAPDVLALVTEAKRLYALKKYDEAFSTFSRAFNAAPSVEIARVLIQIYPKTRGASAAGAARLADYWLIGSSNDLGAFCSKPGLEDFRQTALPMIVKKAEETDKALQVALEQLDQLREETHVKVSFLNLKIEEATSRLASVQAERDDILFEREKWKAKSLASEEKRQQLILQLKGTKFDRDLEQR